MLGFITNNASGETVKVIGKPLTNVFVPTTPNPTSGFLLLLPPEDIFPLSMSVGEGMKMLISGGAVIPPHRARRLKSSGRRRRGGAQKRGESSGKGKESRRSKGVGRSKSGPDEVKAGG